MTEERTDTHKVVDPNSSFEESFKDVSLEDHIAKCEAYELTPLFRRLLPDMQPVLEAGCGSGRWVGWLQNNGMDAVGLDWSETLMEKARRQIPNARFEAGDMRSMPFEDDEFGSIIALGSIEHVAEGPMKILQEFNRVLRPGGLAIVTVPYLSPLRRLSRFLRKPAQWLKGWPLLRRILKKRGWNGQKLRVVKKETLSHLAGDCLIGDEGWYFYQYQFTAKQLRKYIDGCGGFVILDEFADFADEGIYHNLRPLSGYYDHRSREIRFNTFGKFMRRLLPVRIMGHMYCFVLEKKEERT